MARVTICENCGGSEINGTCCHKCVEQSKTLKQRLNERIELINRDLLEGKVIFAQEKLLSLKEYINEAVDN